MRKLARIFIGGLLAARDTGGLCCPVELSGALSAAFLKMDDELLKWLEGRLLLQHVCLQCSVDTTRQPFP